MSFDLSAVLKGVSNLDTERKQIEYIPLNLIDGDPNNFYQLSGIEDLAANIATCTLQQPLLIRNFNPRSPWGERQQRCTIVAWHLWRKVINFSGDFHFRGIEDPQHPAETAFHAQKSVRTSRKFLCASASHYKISVSSG